MIIICGSRDDPSLEKVCRRLEDSHTAYIYFGQDICSTAHMQLRISAAGCDGVVSHGDSKLDLGSIKGVYWRLDFPTDRNHHTERHGNSDHVDPRTSFYEVFDCWLELCAARVLNRTSTMGSNCSKPYQLQLISQAGFAVPDTLVTNDPDEARAFSELHDDVVYKSISSNRSIVQRLTNDDLKRLEEILWCPVQFQQYVKGVNLRVHTIGPHVFGTLVDSSDVDYRYAEAHGGRTNMSPFKLDSDLKDACLRLSRRLRLDFSGIDMILTPDGTPYCLEVNPSPAYVYYEDRTDQPISASVCRYLAGKL